MEFRSISFGRYKVMSRQLRRWMVKSLIYETKKHGKWSRGEKKQRGTNGQPGLGGDNECTGSRGLSSC